MRLCDFAVRRTSSNRQFSRISTKRSALRERPRPPLAISRFYFQRTNPHLAIVEAAKILRKHLNPFIQYSEQGTEVPSEDGPQPAGPPDVVDRELEAKLNMSLAELDLSVRATNCLESEGITTVRELVMRGDEELLEVRNFGETTLREVKNKLSERGLHLGMKLPSAAKR